MSRTHATTPATTWSWGVCAAPPRGNTHINLGAGYASLFVRQDVRQRHRRTIFLRSLDAPSQRRTNGRGITTRGFPSQRGDSCMIVYMSTLRSNFTFSLYSPTIQLGKKIVRLSIIFLSSLSKVKQHLASHNISNLTYSRKSKLGEIFFSVFRFRLVHSSVQVPTRWWSKS